MLECVWHSSQTTIFIPTIFKIPLKLKYVIYTSIVPHSQGLPRSVKYLNVSSLVQRTVAAETKGNAHRLHLTIHRTAETEEAFGEAGGAEGEGEPAQPGDISAAATPLKVSSWWFGVFH